MPGFAPSPYSGVNEAADGYGWVQLASASISDQAPD
jgi:hypothetical protein